jgi:hypothetical protein
MFKAALPTPPPPAHKEFGLLFTYGMHSYLLYGILFVTRASVLDQPLHNIVFFCQLACNTDHTDKKENKIFLIYKEIQSGAVAKSCMRKGFLI